MPSDDVPNQPDPGTDSTVDDWFGQSVERDAELADRVAAETDDAEEAERAFEERSTGRDEQDARHGERIDPDQGQSSYKED